MRFIIGWAWFEMYAEAFHPVPYNIIPRGSSTGQDHDFTIVAPRFVEQAISEQWAGSPLSDRNKGKNPAAVARGKPTEADREKGC